MDQNSCEKIELKISGKGLELKAELSKAQAGRIVSIAMEENQEEKKVGFHK